MSDFLRPDARRRHGKRQTTIVVLDEGKCSSQSDGGASGKAMQDITDQALSTNRAGSRERRDSCLDTDPQTSDWKMLAESSHEMVSQSGRQGNGNECDENVKRGNESKMRC